MREDWSIGLIKPLSPCKVIGKARCLSPCMVEEVLWDLQTNLRAFWRRAVRLMPSHAWRLCGVLVWDGYLCVFVLGRLPHCVGACLPEVCRSLPHPDVARLMEPITCREVIEGLHKLQRPSGACGYPAGLCRPARQFLVPGHAHVPRRLAPLRTGSFQQAASVHIFIYSCHTGVQKGNAG
jgi:hypothetical protein